MKGFYIFASAMLLLASVQSCAAADEQTNMITKQSTHPVAETIQRFEAALAKRGWKVFAEIDHAKAAVEAGQNLAARLVILFGNPKTGTALMQRAPTSAIDFPLRALVWQDDQGNVWLTYNTGGFLADQVFPRHGLKMPLEGRNERDAFLAEVSDEAIR
jgi:uncharacterized protein (DUF302 family)